MSLLQSLPEPLPLISAVAAAETGCIAAVPAAMADGIAAASAATPLLGPTAFLFLLLILLLFLLLLQANLSGWCPGHLMTSPLVRRHRFPSGDQRRGASVSFVNRLVRGGSLSCENLACGDTVPRITALLYVILIGVSSIVVLTDDKMRTDDISQGFFTPILPLLPPGSPTTCSG